MAVMAERSFTIVAIDDDPRALELVQDVFSAEPDVSVATASDASSGLETVRRLRPRIVLLDLVIPGAEGMSVLDDIIRFSPDTDVILVTGNYSTDSAVEAIRKGASDYLTKPVEVSLLRERVGKLLETERRRARANRLNAELMETCQFQGMVGSSPLMLEVFDRIRRVAPHFRTALVTGQTGTGKELVARALHSLSPVQSKALAVSNCSAIVETLFESELFGHVKGAFTGAVADKVGFFEYAAGGAVFLDEIGDMPLTTQTKLLRVIENREYQRVGSPVARKTDVRIIAATNRNLRQLASQGTFREDLYYRLSMIEIKLPSLAERCEDLPLLERYFLERFAREYAKPVQRLTRRAEAVLARYSWPGNVRELENVLGHACMMTDGDVIDVADMPENLHNPPPRSHPEQVEFVPMSVVERRHAAQVLAAMNGNKVQAARILGIHRATLARLLQEDWPAGVARDTEEDAGVLPRSRHAG
jgi:DNA-binding NtrC family response regulator